MSNRTIQVVADAAAIAQTATDMISRLSADAIKQRGTFSIALSGGNTPKTLYELLARDPYPKQIDFKSWDLYFSDERCVPPDHADSNYRMAREALLSRVPIKTENIHRMKGEIDPQQAAIEYGKLLKEKFADGGMDLILLGMGDDGHTASLFPGSKALEETHHRCVANFVAKMNVWRITMTYPFINRARQVAIMVSGGGKTQRLAEVLKGPRDPKRLPIQGIDPVNGQLLWLLDKAAAGPIALNLSEPLEKGAS